MSLFSFRRPKESAPAGDAVSPLSGSEVMTLAREAKEKDDWGAVLVALDRLPSKKNAGAECHALRGWALFKAGRLEEADAAVRKALQLTPDEAGKALLDEIKARRKARNAANKQGRLWARINVGGAHFGLEPADALALTQVVMDVRPRTILELGSCGGGVANWLATLVTGMGIEADVLSADWELRATSTNPKVKFCAGDLRKPGSFWAGQVLKYLSHPCLVLLRSQGGYAVTWPAIRGLHKWLRKGDVICVVNEPDGERTSAQALSRFAGAYPVEYGTLESFEASFGVDGPTTALSCLQHTGLNPLDSGPSAGLESPLGKMQKGEWKAALDELNERKAARQVQRGVDYLRGLCFNALGDVSSAYEAAKEELRYFPDHAHAQAMCATLLRLIFPGKPKLGGAEFHALYAVIRPYTMLSEERLYSIYLRVRMVCQMDVPGDIVECGVAAGGASALMAATVARHSRRKRKVYSCDTFEGLPMPDSRDVHGDITAVDSGWVGGTCAAPTGSLQEVCQKLDVAGYVEPVKGLFADTLPGLKGRLADGIAFLHMDGDWYQSTMDILLGVYENVQPRGYIQVDDYGFWEGCRQAMDDYARQQGFEFTVHVVDSTGVWLQRPRRSAGDLLRLHLGCGTRLMEGWVSADAAPAAGGVLEIDSLTGELPFENASCSAVFIPATLQQPEPAQITTLFQECFRILALGGVLRVEVPDFESRVREYLAGLDAGEEKEAGLLNNACPYDRLILARLLKQAGFGEVSVRSPSESGISGFQGCNDTGGKVLALEARKES